MQLLFVHNIQWQSALIARTTKVRPSFERYKMYWSLKQSKCTDSSNNKKSAGGFRYFYSETPTGHSILVSKQFLCSFSSLKTDTYLIIVVWVDVLNAADIGRILIFFENEYPVIKYLIILEGSSAICWRKIIFILWSNKKDIKWI